MKISMRQILREWERSILWASVVVLALATGVLLSRMAREGAPSQVRLTPTTSPQSYLNEKTAFGFMQPDAALGTSARNPFAFSCRVPPPKGTTTATEQAASANPEPPPPISPASIDAKVTPEDVAKVTPPPPKRTASILYRGLYSGGGDATRQMAFVSTHETPGEVAGTAVLAAGQTAAGGITVKRITPAELVVTGPTGAEVSIAVGSQAQIALE